MEKEKFKIDFIGIGAAKSATSWIAACLADHSQICLAKEKETEFFNREINIFVQPNIFTKEKECFSKYDREGIKGYQKYFRHCQESMIKGEWSVKYLPEPQVAFKIKKEFPDVKILVCLRNPLERALSQFYYAKYHQGFEKCCQSFEEAFEKHPNFYRFTSLYSKALKRYFDLFPKKNILVLIYEEIEKNPLKFIQNIYRFLGVDDSFVPPSLEKKVNPTLRYFHPRLLKIYSQSLKILQKFGGENLINFLKKTQFKKLAEYIKAGEEIEEISIKPETKKNLQKIFTQDIKNLEKLIKKDLSFWK
jgi:hypothetical protein